MSEKKKDGGPAFPEIRIRQDGDPCYCPPTKVYYRGMSLRAYFAGQALTGLLADPNFGRDWTLARTAKHVCAVADAMITELEAPDERD